MSLDISHYRKCPFFSCTDTSELRFLKISALLSYVWLQFLLPPVCELELVQEKGPGRHSRIRISGWGLKIRAQCDSVVCFVLSTQGVQISKSTKSWPVELVLCIHPFVFLICPLMVIRWACTVLGTVMRTQLLLPVTSLIAGWKRTECYRQSRWKEVRGHGGGIQPRPGLQEGLQEEVTSKLRHTGWKSGK